MIPFLNPFGQIAALHSQLPSPVTHLPDCLITHLSWLLCYATVIVLCAEPSLPPPTITMFPQPPSLPLLPSFHNPSNFFRSPVLQTHHWTLEFTACKRTNRIRHVWPNMNQQKPLLKTFVCFLFEKYIRPLVFFF